MPQLIWRPPGYQNRFHPSGLGFSPPNLVAGCDCIPHGVAVVRGVMSKWQQSFLASTEWAKSEEIEASDIKLFRWEQE